MAQDKVAVGRHGKRQTLIQCKLIFIVQGEKGTEIGQTTGNNQPKSG